MQTKSNNVPNKQCQTNNIPHEQCVKHDFIAPLMFRKESSANLVSNIKRIRFLMVPVGRKVN